MKILFLNLASNSALPNEGACIACVSEQKTEAIRFIDNRIGDAGIMPLLGEVLAEATWDDRDLTHIACVTGPGGFTSLRLAVTLANTYSDQLQIPIAGLKLPDLYRTRATSYEDDKLRDTRSSKLEARSFIWLHSTKKTQLFIQGFGDASTLWPEPMLIALEDLMTQLPQNISIVGEILPEHREAIAGKNPQYPEIASVADTLPRLLNDLPYTQKSLEPWYGRGW